MLRRSWKNRTILLLCAGFMIFLSLDREVFAQTLDEARRLNQQLTQLCQQGKYTEALPLAKRALEIRKGLLGDKHADAAQSYNNLGFIYQSMGEYGEAEPLLQKALGINREMLGEKHQETTATYNNLGGLYYLMGEYGKAQLLLQKTLETRREILGEKHPDTAMSYGNLGELYKSLGEYSKAEPLLQKALQTRREVLGEKHPDTAMSYGNLGELYKSLGEYSKAEHLLQTALEIFREVLGEKHPQTATTYGNLGCLYASVGQYSKAEPLDQNALEINREVLGERHPVTATSYSNLGVLYQAIGEYGKAQLFLQNALQIDREVLGERHPSTATCYNNMASLCQDVGEHGKAEQLYQTALGIRREVLGEKHPDTARIYSNLGVLYYSMSEYGKAELFLQKALGICRSVLGEKHPDTAGCYDSLGALYLAKGELERAVEIFTKGNAPDGLGACHLAKKEYGKAQREFSRALQNSERRGEKEFVVGSHIGLGLAAEGLGDLGKARKNFNRAVDIIESQRAEVGGASRDSFLGGRAGVGFSRLEAYEGMIRVLQKERQKGYEAEALHYAERIKARGFLEMLTSRGVKGRSGTDQKILDQDHDLRVKLASLEKEVQKLEELGDKAPRGRIEAAKKELTQASEQYENFLKEVKLKGGELASLLAVEVPPIEKLQAQLEPGTTLVEYFTGKEKTYAWLMTRERVQMFEIPAGQRKVEEMVNTVLLPNISNRSRRPEPKIILAPTPTQEAGEAERMTNRQHFLDAQKEIFQTFFSPLKGEIKTGRLIIVPHGALHKVPFSALSDGTRCLAEDYEITLLPSASVLPQVASKRKADKGELLALGNPTTDAVPLGFAEKEVETIARAFLKKQVYTKAKASKVRLKKESGSPSVLHLACHGEFNDRQPLQSGLLLAREGDDDGRLQVHEVFSLDLKNTSLVTLSACETALGKVTSGDDMVGLSRAFLYAGTPSLIASLWQVDDASTALLMERFYDNWRNKKMPKPEALRQAQLSLKAMPAHQHPYYWAGFELIGDWQ